MRPIRDVIAGLLGIKPQNVQGQNNLSCEYYRQELLNKVLGRITIEGMPEWWDSGYVMTTLLINGYVGMFYLKKYGPVALECGTYGQNLFYRPTKLQTTNPVINNVRRKLVNNLPDFPEVINKEEYGSLVRLTWNRRGISDKLDRYAYLLSQCDASMAVNLMNTKTTMIFAASSKKESDEYKSIVDDINAGKPAVYINENLLKNGNSLFITNPAKQNFIASDIMTLKRSITNEFLTEIGINNANTDKKERLNSEEVNANNEEIQVNVEQWIEQVNYDLKSANRLLGLNMEFKLKEYKDKTETITNTSTEGGTNNV